MITFSMATIFVFTLGHVYDLSLRNSMYVLNCSLQTKVSAPEDQPRAKAASEHCFGRHVQDGRRVTCTDGQEALAVMRRVHKLPW